MTVVELDVIARRKDTGTHKFGYIRERTTKLLQISSLIGLQESSRKSVINDQILDDSSAVLSRVSCKSIFPSLSHCPSKKKILRTGFLVLCEIFMWVLI